MFSEFFLCLVLNTTTCQITKTWSHLRASDELEHHINIGRSGRSGGGGDTTFLLFHSWRHLNFPLTQTWMWFHSSISQPAACSQSEGVNLGTLQRIEGLWVRPFASSRLTDCKDWKLAPSTTLHQHLFATFKNATHMFAKRESLDPNISQSIFWRKVHQM